MPRIMKARSQKDISIPILIVASFRIAKRWK
jgi:hypothetical protein